MGCIQRTISGNLPGEKSSKGIRLKVGGVKNFQGFLKDPKNKDELFNLLTKTASSHMYRDEKIVYITSG